MDIYYRVSRDTETGEKFADLNRRKKKVYESTKDFAAKYGFTKFRYSPWALWGGLSGCIDFKETPNPKIWKQVRKGEYMPKLSSLEGKEIDREMKQLPRIGVNELNNIVGFNCDLEHSHIGYSLGDNFYYGFILGDDMEANVPKDCEEITASQYKQLTQGL